MNSKERFYSTMKYKGFDRALTTYYGGPEINSNLMQYFGISSYEELQIILGDDFRHIEPKYIGPELKTYNDGQHSG